MRLLVVGCGSIGRRHARNASELLQKRNGGLAVCDTNRSASEACAGDNNASAFSELHAALAWAPDAVVVATPHNTHVPIALDAVNHGAHVLIEKPLSHNTDGVVQLLEQAEVLGKKVFGACNMRFHPGVRALHEHLPDIGRPLFAKAHFGNYLPGMRPDTDYRNLYAADPEQGGVVLDSIQTVEYLTWMLGPVTQVMCRASRVSDLEIPVEDYAVILLLHGSGVESGVHVDYVQRFKRRGCEIVGTEGTLIWNSNGKRPEGCHVQRYLGESAVGEVILDHPDVDANEPYRQMLCAFLQALGAEVGGRVQTVSLQTGWEAARVLDVVLAAKNAAKEQRVVNLGT